MTKLDIFEITKYLKEKGINVGFIAGANDKVFPMDEINKKASGENLDYYISTNANHGSIIFDHKHAQLAENILDNMKRKKGRES